MTHAALWLFGLAVGAAAGWLAGARFAGRRHAGAWSDSDDSSESMPVSALRAADAAADLPPGAKLEVLARLLADRSAERVGLPCAVVLREVEGGPIIITTVSAGFDARLVGIGVDPDSAAGRAVTEGLPIVALAHEPVLQAGSRDRRRPLHGGVAVPIRSGSYVEGAVLALGEPAGPASEAIARLESLVRRFAPVLGPAHAVAIAERRAATDELTGLANRRAFKAAMGSGDPARSALILLDLDRFKGVNDTLGHPAGDAALKHLAQLLKTAVRAGDVAARIGGEEFAVWLPGAELSLALEIAERLRALVAERPFRFAGAQHPFTISCGVSACPVPITHPDNLMAAADSALYRAKREGRNRVVASTGKDG